jgi:ergothioneine biosynthesis protein EgtB
VIPSPAASAVREELEAAWQRSDFIFGLVAREALLARPIRLRQPFLFYVGHLPAFAWNHLWRGALSRPAFADRLDTLFERGIDPPDDEVAVDEDHAAWPPLDEVLAYRDRVRRELLPLVDEPALADVLPMVVEHELMHHETLLYMLHQLDAPSKVRPDGLPAPVGGRASASEPVLIPAGRVVLGAPRGTGFLWDNERPSLAVEVEAFRIDSRPVTNHDFLAFVEAGGYEDRRLWTDDAWRWLERRGRRLPQFWRREGSGLRVVTLFDERPFAEAAGWPASVAQCEAAAFARWHGARLPTEAEIHRAAFGTPAGVLREHPWGDGPPRPGHGNLGFRLFEPTPAGAHPEGASAFGVDELVGNGWEWTSTPFGPLPGFSPLPRYPGYSADFFDGRHFVLLGASWATDARLVRRSFRNWFQPHYPYVFSKFRCARPA